MDTSSEHGTSDRKSVRLLLLTAWRARRLGIRRLADAPAAERVIEGLHRATVGLAEVTSEVSAYAGLLEEKTGELRAKTAARRSLRSPNGFSTASYGIQVTDQEPARR